VLLKFQSEHVHSLCEQYISVSLVLKRNEAKANNLMAVK